MRQFSLNHIRTHNFYDFAKNVFGPAHKILVLMDIRKSPLCSPMLTYSVRARGINIGFDLCMCAARTLESICADSCSHGPSMVDNTKSHVLAQFLYRRLQWAPYDETDKLLNY